MSVESIVKSIYDADKESLGFSKPLYYKLLCQWLKKGVNSFDKMTDLPKTVIENLKAKYTSPILSEVIDVKKDISSTKLLLKLYDGLLVECVLLKREDGLYTACVSSEVGCTMKCEFCATGSVGFKRALNWWEIIEQFFHLKALNNELDRVVFMGMGEPLCNFENVKRAIEYIKGEIGMSPRRITVSTSGIAPGIKALADSKLGVKLALSLVTANDSVRNTLMSASRLYSLTELKKALLYYSEKENRRIALEYCMLKGVNTDRKSADELKNFTKGLIYSVNLIPWNKLNFLPFDTPSAKEIKEFEGYLNALNVKYTIRVSRGRDTSAACGMLVAKNKGGV